MLSRLAQPEQMQECFIQMWMQNPALARQGGSKVQSLLCPLKVADAVISPGLSGSLALDIERDGT